MKRIIIICEGQTEQEFCKDVLQHHFNPRMIQIHAPAIKKTGGGMVSWGTLKKQIENHLKEDSESIVTTLIDYYGIFANHLFPSWEDSKNIPNLNDRMFLLEKAMKDSIDHKVSSRFIPYIQLHEFEGLLFNDINVFINQIPATEIRNLKELSIIIDKYPNPELINNSPDTAPSARLKNLIIGYNKIVYGAILAQSIGLERIRFKCPRFNSWVNNLENI